MKRTGWLGLAVTVLLMAATVSALAAENRVTLTTQSAVQVSGKKFAEGTYDLSWKGSGDAVQVTFKRSNREIATVPAKLVERASASGVTAVVRDADGKLVEIRLSGKKTVLVFAN